MTTEVFLGMREENRMIRKTVFMEEQGFSCDEDARDAMAFHALAKDTDTPVGTARLYEENGGFFVGRFAVLKDYRGRGIGRMLMDALIEKAKELGAQEVTLFAQVRAAAFYERMGFVRTPQITYDEDVSHVTMKRLFYAANPSERKSVLFVNACVRGDQSRTLTVARAFLDELDKTGLYKIDEIAVDGAHYAPLTFEGLVERNAVHVNLDCKLFAEAKRFASYDRIVIAAPFWDMSFPAALKCYFEQISIEGITFKMSGENSVGLCRAKKLMYITTRGLNIADGSDMEQAYGYIRAMCRFFGIGVFDAVSAYGLDTSTPDIQQSRLNAAVKLARTKARSC